MNIFIDWSIIIGIESGPKAAPVLSRRVPEHAGPHTLDIALFGWRQSIGVFFVCVCRSVCTNNNNRPTHTNECWAHSINVKQKTSNIDEEVPRRRTEKKSASEQRLAAKRPQQECQTFVCALWMADISCWLDKYCRVWDNFELLSFILSTIYFLFFFFHFIWCR